MSSLASPARLRPRTFAALTAVALAGAATLLASSTLASAGQMPPDGLQTNVYYNLRELSTERGTLAVYRRIVRAAQAVCPGYDSDYLAVVAASKECQRQAVSRAIARIGNARLAALGARAGARHG